MSSPWHLPRSRSTHGSAGGPWRGRTPGRVTRSPSPPAWAKAMSSTDPSPTSPSVTPTRTSGTTSSSLTQSGPAVWKRSRASERRYRAGGRRIRSHRGGQARPQEADADRHHHEREQAPDDRFWHPGVQAGADISAGQAANPQGDPRRPVRGHAAVLVNRQDGERDHAGERGDEGRTERGGRDLGGRLAVGDQDRGQDGSAADAVDAADAARDGGHQADHGARQPGLAGGAGRGHLG